MKYSYTLLIQRPNKCSCSGSTQVLLSQDPKSSSKDNSVFFLGGGGWRIAILRKAKQLYRILLIFCSDKMMHCWKKSIREASWKVVFFLQNKLPVHKAGKMLYVLKNLGFECMTMNPTQQILLYLIISQFPKLRSWKENILLMIRLW